MKSMKKYWISVCASLLLAIGVCGQEESNKPEPDGPKGAHRLSVMIGHSHLNKGIMENGKRGWTSNPSWAIDYDYWISDRWAIGLQNDIVVETFEVEDNNDEVIERTKPVTSLASLLFKPKEHILFIVGAGGEFAKEEDFFVTRLGIESGWEIKNNWEFGVGLAYDIKWNGYNAWSINVGISKFLKKSRK
jgi:hypothetical protein